MFCIPLSAGDKSTETDYYITIELQDIFKAAFPSMAQQFEDEVAAKKKPTKKRGTFSIVRRYSQ